MSKTTAPAPGTKPPTPPPASTRKPRVKADPNEGKDARFLRLATKRMTRAVKAIAMIGNLSGSGYASTELQRKQIADALHASVEKTVTKLNGVKAVDTSFSFKG